MKKKISFLTGIFGLQLIFALSIFALGKSSSGGFHSEALLNFELDKVDKLVVNDQDDEVTLSKTDGRWQLAKDGLPIDQKKLDSLIKQLSDLKTTWPVTTTSSSHDRFELSEKKYRRKIRFFHSGKTLGELYVGTSPGFKKSHLRVDDQDEVYALEFNAYDAPATYKDWLDKSLLSVESLSRIKGKDYTLTKEGDMWKLPAPLNSGDIDQDKVDELAQAIAAFKVMDIAKDAPEFHDDKSTVLEVDNGKTFSLSLTEKNGAYFVKRSGLDPVFTLSKYEYDRLNKPTIDLLASEPEPASEDEHSESEADKKTKTEE